MKLKISDLEIIGWPPEGDGMQCGRIPVGVRITHKPTGTVVQVVSDRHQYKNREIALQRMAEILDSV